MINKSLLLVISFLITGLSGCDSSRQDELMHYIYEIKIRKPKPIEPIPAFSTVHKFIYPENDTRRSPFKKKEVQKVDVYAPNTKRVKEPLEAFPLDSLKFVGIMQQGNKIWALITEPSGEVAQVTVGNYLGQNFGKIISINKTTIKLEESIQRSGKWEKRVITININAS